VWLPNGTVEYRGAAVDEVPTEATSEYQGRTFPRSDTGYESWALY